jgi:hypothetical protein
MELLQLLCIAFDLAYSDCEPIATRTGSSARFKSAAVNIGIYWMDIIYLAYNKLSFRNNQCGD